MTTALERGEYWSVVREVIGDYTGQMYCDTHNVGTCYLQWCTRHSKRAFGGCSYFQLAFHFPFCLYMCRESNTALHFVVFILNFYSNLISPYSRFWLFRVFSLFEIFLLNVKICNRNPCCRLRMFVRWSVRIFICLSGHAHSIYGMQI